MKLTINEIYSSIQGESTWAGLPCVFVRTAFCNLRCTYCDTAYAFYKGTQMKVSEVLHKVESFGCSLVEVTGGEPLLQKGVFPLMRALCDRSFRVLLETSGSIDIFSVDHRVHRIVDLKTPSSGESDRNRMENIPHLTHLDEVKFVLGSRNDYEWAKKIVHEWNLASRCHAVLLSPVFGKIASADIVRWMLEDRLPARLQLQMHKFIWNPTQKGV